MALDLAALKAKLAAQKEALNGQFEISTPSQGAIAVVTTDIVRTGTDIGSSTNNSAAIATVTVPAILGTAKTSEIDHLDFLSKMNRLAEAIHSKHPTMPVLLMQIHKQLRADPELVTTLDEDAIGIVVKGLQVQTKTELVSVVVKESKSKAKKTPLTLDML